MPNREEDPWVNLIVCKNLPLAKEAGL